MDSERHRFDKNIEKYKTSDKSTKIFNQIQVQPKRNKLKILVVDDLAFNRITVISMLKSLKFIDIAEAENGQQAVSIIKEIIDSFDKISVFMDIDMPILNGIEATLQIKRFD